MEEGSGVTYPEVYVKLELVGQIKNLHEFRFIFLTTFLYKFLSFNHGIYHLVTQYIFSNVKVILFSPLAVMGV